MEFDYDDLLDFLKFAAATVDHAGAQLCDVDPHSSPQATTVTVETAICHLTTARHLLQHIVGVVCPHCAGAMDHYADGRSVTSQLRFCEGSQFVHLWHPDPVHPWNRPHEVGTLTTRNGTRKQIVVSAPGHLDSVTVTVTVTVTEPGRSSFVR